MPSHWNLIFKRLRNFYSKGKSHTYKPWMRLNPSSIRRKFWRSGMAEVKWGHSSLWQICCLVPQKELHCLVQCSSSETVLIYKIHELLPIRSDHLCTKMSFQEAGEHCLRYCCLEKMSPSPPHTPCSLQRSPCSAESFRESSNSWKFEVLQWVHPAEGWLLMSPSCSEYEPKHKANTKALTCSGIPFYFPSLHPQSQAKVKELKGICGCSKLIGTFPPRF